MSHVFTAPGKIGDAFLQLPVAYQASKKLNEKVIIWLDEKTLKPIVNLLQYQPWVEAVELKPGIQHYGCGGQPFHFDLKTEDFLGHSVHHLGFAAFPERQITLQTAMAVGIDLDTEALATESCFVVPEMPAVNRLVLHGTFLGSSGCPRFWRWLWDNHKDLESRFDEISFIGPPEERARALELYPDWKDFDDKNDFLQTAAYMQSSRMVAGSGSCGVALASVLKIPCVRVHDPIGEAPRVIWSGLGPNQLNDTEIGLRESWPKFRDQWAAAPVDAIAEEVPT